MIDFTGYLDRDCEERIIYKTPGGALKARICIPGKADVIEDVAREEVARWILQCTIPEEFEGDFLLSSPTQPEGCLRMPDSGAKQGSEAGRGVQSRKRKLGPLSKADAARHRFIPLTEMQIMQMDSAPGGFQLNAFLQIATHKQLVMLRGATPLAWQTLERTNRVPKPVHLIAIVKPTDQELRSYRLPQRQLAARRRQIATTLRLRGDCRDGMR